MGTFEKVMVVGFGGGGWVDVGYVGVIMDDREYGSMFVEEV